MKELLQDVLDFLISLLSLLITVPIIIFVFMKTFTKGNQHTIQMLYFLLAQQNKNVIDQFGCASN